MVRYAILISCEEYEHYNNICYCHNDLFSLEDTLINFCDYESQNIISEMIYIGADVSNCDYWYTAIKTILQKANEDDTVLFYFAGHGKLVNEDAYLLLPNSVPDKENETALSLAQINQIFKESNCTNFRVLDSCHSGIDVRGCIDNIFDAKVIDKSWATFASCSKSEVSFPDTKLEQGIFTYNVVEAIKSWAKGKDISIEELKIEVNKRMQVWCNRTGLSQHPTLNASLVGKNSFATRNDKISEYEVIIYDKEIIPVKEDFKKVKNEIEIIKSDLTALWSASEGIHLPKIAKIESILNFNVQLREKEITGIVSLYIEERFEFVSEIIWERSILILRDRVLSLGLEFVGEMVGLDNLDYIKSLPPFEVINLASELGFINNTGKMRLSQSNEIVQHYKGRDVNEEMPQNESDTVVRACIQYILGYDSSEISLEYGDFRNTLKHEIFEKNSDRIEMLINSPYFYKKTTIRTLVNLIASTDGAEFETVVSNFSIILEGVWDSLSSDDRYFIGITYSKYANKGEVKYIKALKQALLKVHGFDYVPENLRSLSFIQAAKRVKGVHYEFDNFHNEPSMVQKLEKLGSKIPSPAIRETVSSVLMVILGNSYGVSYDAIDPAKKVLSKLDNGDWCYYLDNCLPYDEEVLSKLKSGDERTVRWCTVVNEYELNKLELKDRKMLEMLEFSVQSDISKVKTISGVYLNKIKQ